MDNIYSEVLNIVEIFKLIIENCELDELKQLTIVNKYFRTIVYIKFPKLTNTLLILDEFHQLNEQIPPEKNKENWAVYYNIKFRQIHRKTYEFIFKLLRKNLNTFVAKIINQINKCGWSGNIPYYNILFQKIILENYCNEQKLLTSLIEIHPRNINWKETINCFGKWNDDLQIENIVISILDLLKSAICANNEDLIVSLIKQYYTNDLYNWEDETKDDVLYELNHLITSLKQSDNKYNGISDGRW